MRLTYRTTIAGLACAVLAGPTLAGPAEDLIDKGKCNKCHTAKTTKKAPSFASIAEKYKGQPGAADKLATMLKTGGTDDHDKLAASDADLKAVAAFVLSSK
jgi:cytochrome c